MKRWSGLFACAPLLLLAACAAGAGGGTGPAPRAQDAGAAAEASAPAAPPRRYGLYPSRISPRQAGPLYIVDGVILTSGKPKVKLKGIVSIEVIKGNPATALYGTRAADGVVLVNTRTGRRK